MFTVELEGADALENRLARLPDAVREALARKIEELAARLEQKIKNNLSGAGCRREAGRFAIRLS